MNNFPEEVHETAADDYLEVWYYRYHRERRFHPTQYRMPDPLRYPFGDWLLVNNF